MLARSVVVAALLCLLGSPVAGQDPAGTLVLRNVRWDRVRIDARLGSSADCGANPSVGVRTLRRDRGWAFVSGKVVCWRREVVPGDSTQGWTDWEQVRVPAATRREVEL